MYELMPHAGLGSLGRARRDWDSLWDRLWRGAGAWPAESEQGAFVPSVDVQETADALEITAEAPGLKPEEMEITLTGDVLTLRGEKKAEREDSQGDYHLVERRYGRFQRSFRLPVEVDREKLTATHKDGVLTVRLPKAAQAGPARIEVKGE
jgi:HSP20 family protein